MNCLQSELMKYKRTFVEKLIAFFPVFFAVYAIIIQVMMNNPLSEVEAMSWQILLSLIFNWWSFLFLPLGFALFAILVANQEKKAGNYRALRTHNITPQILWVNKVVAMSILSLCSTLVLIVVTIINGLVSTSAPAPVGKIILAGLSCWVTSLTLIPIQLWIASWKGMIMSMGVGCAGMVIGVIAAPTSFWIVVPWSWATRLMCPIIGVHPNNTLLGIGDPLLNPIVIPLGIIVSLLAFIIVTILTAVWFNREDGK